VPDFIPEQHGEGLKLGPNQIAEERGALGRDPLKRAELHGEESFVERFSKEREASWRVSSRREEYESFYLKVLRQIRYRSKIRRNPQFQITRIVRHINRIHFKPIALHKT